MSELPFFEFLIYVVPGFFALVGILLAIHMRGLINIEKIAENQTVAAFSLLVVSFGLGLLIHISATSFFTQIQRVTFSPIPEITEHFDRQGDLDTVRKAVEEKLGVTTEDHIDLYRYAGYILVNSGSPLQKKVERLQGLAIMSRNLVISCLIICASVLFGFETWKRGVAVNLVFSATAIIIIGLLTKGAFNYTVATILAVYRSIVIIHLAI